MEEKINTEEIKRYSREFAKATVGVFFTGKEKITGQEILMFCSVQQVNLFIVLELMNAWAKEKNKLISPYFNYSAKPVQDALAQFHNTLSNHIAIARSDFSPLVEQAVFKTLSLIISPYDFYSSILDNNGQDFLRVADLKNEIKYIKINGAPLERLLQKLAEENKSEVLSGKEAFALLDGILEEVNFSPEDPEGYLAGFSKTVKVTLSRFYEPVILTPPPQAKKIIPSIPARKVQSLPLQTTLYDQLSSGETKSTLADNFQKRKIAKLRDSLSINQKFMFTKILFNGDFDIFNQAIERIDRMDNLQQALNYLQQDYPEWDNESEEFMEFHMMVQKRFLEEEVGR